MNRPPPSFARSLARGLFVIALLVAAVIALGTGALLFSPDVY